MTTLDFTWEVREELVKRDAREEGIEKGIEKGVRDSLQNLMKNLGLSKEEAMDALGIEGKERERYRED